MTTTPNDPAGPTDAQEPQPGAHSQDAEPGTQTTAPQAPQRADGSGGATAVSGPPDLTKPRPPAPADGEQPSHGDLPGYGEKAPAAGPSPHGPSPYDPQQDPYGQQQDPYGQSAAAGAFGQAAQPDPYGQQQAYGQQPAGYGAGVYGAAPYATGAYPAQSGAPSSGLAVGALVCGVLGILFSWCGFIGLPLGIAGVVLGVIAQSKVKQGTGGGGRMALAGLICGALAVVLAILVIVVFVASGSAGFGTAP